MTKWSLTLSLSLFSFSLSSSLPLPPSLSLSLSFLLAAETCYRSIHHEEGWREGGEEGGSKREGGREGGREVRSEHEVIVPLCHKMKVEHDWNVWAVDIMRVVLLQRAQHACA